MRASDSRAGAHRHWSQLFGTAPELIPTHLPDCVSVTDQSRGNSTRPNAALILLMCRCAGPRSAKVERGAGSSSFNGTTGNSALPRGFNALLGTLTPGRNKKSMRISPTGRSKEAGRARPQRQADGGRSWRMNQALHPDPVAARTLGFSSRNYNFLLPPPFSRVPPSDWQPFKPVKSHQGAGGLSSCSLQLSIVDLQTY